MKLHHLRDFIAASEQGSLRAAARQLGMAQPSLSRSVQELERELGTVLFERHSKGAVLTPMGRIFLRRARAAVTELKLGKDELDQLQGGQSGSVTLYLSVAAHMALLGEVLEPFHARYPKVSLQIMEGALATALAGLKDGSIDFYAGLLPTQPISSELVAETLFDNFRIIVGRAGHPLTKAASLKELVNADWFNTAASDQLGGEVSALFAGHGLPEPRIVGQLNSTLTGIVVLSRTDALAIVPRQWASFAPTSAFVNQIPVREKIPSGPIALIKRSTMPLTPAAEYFCDLLRRASLWHETLASAR